ncbi:ankyrin repeat domain-containing protein [Thalassobacillus sp. C254]|uniref:ankyrin repeat domain-containing protein n=1 Tax=Thalassobacillus sp. C254 TaxID=1225341 RepID=UPI0006CF20DC|nr:ankyrin repeat domain-containing protein [Thalassobacillus sp. C254]
MHDALFTAARTGNPDVVTQLVQTEVNIGSDEKRVEIVRILLEAGADPDARHSSGRTAYEMRGKVFQEILLEYGADPNPPELSEEELTSLLDESKQSRSQKLELTDSDWEPIDNIDKENMIEEEAEKVPETSPEQTEISKEDIVADLFERSSFITDQIHEGMTEKEVASVLGDDYTPFISPYDGSQGVNYHFGINPTPPPSEDLDKIEQEEIEWAAVIYFLEEEVEMYFVTGKGLDGNVYDLKSGEDEWMKVNH